jgi:hypothetical protein
MDHDKKDRAAPAARHSPAAKRENPDREDYAEHLARATPDADRNKALLKARYRALRDGAGDDA